MKKIIFIFFLIGFVSCKNETKSPNQAVGEYIDAKNLVEKSSKAVNTEIPVLNFEAFEKYLHKDDGTIYVVNFWATWCAPCVKELPYFEALGTKYKNKNVKVVLTSLDFNIKKLNAFLKKNPLKSEIVLLDDPDQNAWIPKVSENWTGAIPATVIYGNGKRKFYEHSFTQAELENEIKRFLTK